MEYFKIEEHRSRYYVMPTAEYLLSIGMPEQPLDTNYLIYKLFNYSPKEFITFLCSGCEAQVIILKDFPYIDFSFSKYTSAASFLENINKRVVGAQEKIM